MNGGPKLWMVMGLKNIEEQVASKTHSDYVLHNMASIAAVWANMAQARTELLWSAMITSE